jgi:4-aminobutyrate aminotransferase-like enzyme
MRFRGVLLTRDGPHENVLKIKPPMTFNAKDADKLVQALDATLRELEARGAVRMVHT